MATKNKYYICNRKMNGEVAQLVRASRYNREGRQAETKQDVQNIMAR